VYSDTKAGNSSGSVYIPEADGKTPFVFICPGPDYVYPSGSDPMYLLVVSITPSGTLSWVPVENYFQGVLSGQTTIFVYVCDEKG
jgi:hypothetical protein